MQTKTGWKIDFKNLSKLASGHKEFIADVRRCWKENEEHGWLIGIKVFTWEKGAGTQWVGVAFRTAKSISYLACHATMSSVIEGHYNEDFVAQMAEVL